MRDAIAITLRALRLILALPVSIPRRIVKPPPATYVVVVSRASYQGNPMRVRLVYNRRTALGVHPRAQDQVFIQDDPKLLDPYVQAWLATWCDRCKLRFRRSSWAKDLAS